MGGERTISLPFALLSYPFRSLHSHTSDQGIARAYLRPGRLGRILCPPAAPLDSLPAGRGCPLRKRFWGMWPGQFPRSSHLRVGPSPRPGNQNLTLQNTNYCCFQSSTAGVAGPCPGSPNNLHLWHFSHPWWGAGSRDPWVLRRREPLPGAQPGTGRCREAGRRWGRVGVCVRGGCKVKKGRI